MLSFFTSGIASGDAPARALRLPTSSTGRWLWLGRLLGAGALALLIGYVPYHLYLRSGLRHYVSLRAELVQLTATNQKLHDTNTELRLQLGRLQEDDGEIERVARDELGLIRSGEIVYKVE